MRLRFSPTSPFVRKVRVAAHILGLDNQITLEDAEVTDVADPLRKQNPLGKIPCLVLDNGDTLYDSRVIIEYLDDLATTESVFPAEASDRWPALRNQALADGLMDAAILQVYEKRYRGETERSASWVAYQADKDARALDAFAANPPKLSGPPDVGQIALACALSYLDLRFDGDWRRSHKTLEPWLETFREKVPYFVSTSPR